ncbi:MAG: response regulator transcription factor [Ramlibacter sp.]|nr:response regulator transcription factor [Ramlibacter sp.]
MTALLLVDDHSLVRRGMRDALCDEGFTIAAEAADWPQLDALLGHVTADVMLLDINMPGPSGLDVLALLKARPNAPRPLVVSMYPEDPYAVRSLQAGAWGYVAKSGDTGVLVEAIRTVSQGRKFISPALAGALADAAATQAPRELLPHQRLSPREQVLLGMLASGKRLPDIAVELEMPERTVSVYRARLMEKMRMSTTAELAHYARRYHLLPAG